MRGDYEMKTIPSISAKRTNTPKNTAYKRFCNNLH